MGHRSPFIIGVLAGLAASAIWAAITAVFVQIAPTPFTSWTSVAIVAAYTLLGAAISVSIGLFYYQRQQLVLYPSTGFRWRVMEKRIIYEIDDSGILHFSRAIKARALTNNQDRYLDKFVWTGGSSGLPSGSGDIDRNTSVVHAGIWTIYESVINRSLRKGEIADIINRWPPLANWSSSSPFVSTSADGPTNKIVFEIRIPERFRATDRIIVEEMRSIESTLPFATSVCSFENSEFRYEVSPSAFRHFRIRWAWAGEEEAITVRDAIQQDSQESA